MKNKFGRLAFVAAVVGAVSGAQAITFTNVHVTGDADVIGALGVDHFVNIGIKDIDFLFNHAIVGDFRPVRESAINITFEAEADQLMILDKLVLSFTNILLGTGKLFFQEIVEDLDNPGVIADFSVWLDSTQQGPFFHDIHFSRWSKRIKVKKTIFLIAQPDIPNQLDLAGVGLVEQNIECVPEPASLAALGLGIAAVVARRRKA